MKPALSISHTFALPPPNRGWSARRRQMETVHDTPASVLAPEKHGLLYRLGSWVFLAIVFIPLLILLALEARDLQRKERD